MNETRHSQKRAQQRCIPPMIDRLLDEFGEEVYDSRGGLTLYFSKRSKRRMQRALGRNPVKKLSEFLNVYRVDNSNYGSTITRGHRYKPIRRK